MDSNLFQSKLRGRKKLHQFVRRHGAGEIVSLGFQAVMFVQDLCLLDALNPFSDHIQAQTERHGGYCGKDLLVFFGFVNVEYK